MRRLVSLKHLRRHGTRPSDEQGEANESTGGPRDGLHWDKDSPACFRVTNLTGLESSGPLVAPPNGVRGVSFAQSMVALGPRSRLKSRADESSAGSARLVMFVTGEKFGKRSVQPEPLMSRAFVNEDSGNRPSGRRFLLPPREDPGYDAAAARAILDAAREGDTGAAEEATGYYWGESRLRVHVERILATARKEHDDRLVQLAERWLR